MSDIKERQNPQKKFGGAKIGPKIRFFAIFSILLGVY